MKLISFEASVIARASDDRLLIALIAGGDTASQQRIAAMLSCRPETAQSLCAGIGSALKEPKP